MRGLISFLLFLVTFYAVDVNALVHQQTSRNKIEVSATETKETILVTFTLIPQNGWKIYSHNPGEIGLATDAKWTLYEHELLSESWDEGEDIIFQGYGLNVFTKPSKYVAVLSKALGKMPEVQISWMACREECVPESLSFELTPEVFSNRFTNPATDKKKVEIYENKNVVDMGATLSKGGKTADESLLKMLLLAFLGGLVLNFMPCVFPILFIKIMSVSRQNDKTKNLTEAMLYVAGVLLCFLLIAGLLAWLKFQGAELGWGFQLQSPYFVGFMAVLFFVLGLMFLNIVQLNWSLKYLPNSSFMTGFLAVLIASPCTAPFMGAAVGWALTSHQEAYLYYPVFLSLGLGYALPFFLAGVYPQVLQKILPRPGVWMEVLKKVFSLPMFATCVWLLWVLWSGSTIEQKSVWQNYDEAKIEQHLLKKDKVFINFTAKWCITCLVNEKTVFSQPEFAKLMKKHQVYLYKADWTNRDEKITKALAEYGRSSIPLYVYYQKSGNYEMLPQLITIGDIEKVLANDNSATKD